MLVEASSCSAEPADLRKADDDRIRIWRARAAVRAALEEKPVAKIDDRTLIMADVGRKAITQVKEAASELLTRRLPEEKATAVAEQLATGMWTHDYPIWASTAKSLGLPVSTNMPDDVLQLLTKRSEDIPLHSSRVDPWLGDERLGRSQHCQALERCRGVPSVFDISSDLETTLAS